MKKNKFIKILIIYSGILLVVGALFVGYVVVSLKDYEANQISTYAKSVLTRGEYDDRLVLSEYETCKDIKKALQTLVDSTEIKVKEIGKNAYSIRSDGVELAKFVVEEGQKVTRLGILNYAKLSVKELTFVNGDAIYAYTVQIPSTFTLEVNGKVVDSSLITGEEVLDGFNDSKSKNAPMNSVYILNGFVCKPEIIVKDESGNTVVTKVNENTLSYNNFFKTDDEKDAMSRLVESIDVMKLAENYSLFMTNDLQGARHGFDVLEPYFITGTEIYKQAYEWATGIDITFVSDHRFKNPMFSNESLSQFEVYSDRAFSVLVHLDKNMIISGRDQSDTINSRWYFVHDNGWKLVNMKHVSDGN